MEPARENEVPKGNATGGCSIGCAGVFVVTFLLFPVLHMIGDTWEGGEMMMIPMLVGVPSFIVAHVLALIAWTSRSRVTRRAGQIALVIMWGSIALLVVTGYVHDWFFREPRSETSP